jgi:peroxiredoxin Q/BCP
MMTRIAAFAAALLLAPLTAGFGQAARTDTPRTLSAGDPAPEFSLTGSDGRTYKLSDYRGKQAVVLAWFARAFSTG